VAELKKVAGGAAMRAGARILITGGAGFIGSHLADALIARGYRVRVLDNLSLQVHGSKKAFPAHLSRDVEALHGDVRSRADVSRALAEVEAVIHLAAVVGVGQSMYEIETYTDVNNRGTAVLLETLLRGPPKRLIVASSMSIYGEGLYRSRDGGICAPRPRSLAQLAAGRWDLLDEQGEPLTPVGTTETKAACPESIYALSKHDQEAMCLLLGRSYGVPVVALRFFNVYGERQALANPYTGVLAIFAARYLNDRAPVIFEDGRQRRDFVHVRDVAEACVLALESPEARDVVLNIGSGHAYTILEVATRLGEVLGKEHIEPQLCGRYRAGDIRNCFADISQAQAVLGFHPRVHLDDGLVELGAWLRGQMAEDRSEVADSELRRRGLLA
jgi:dTDP-L-rhamnose 4-epimerase